MVKATGFAGKMNTGNQSTQLSQEVLIIEIGRSPASARRNRDSEIVQVVQRFTVDCYRGHNRDVRIGKLNREVVFFLYRQV